MNSSVQEYVRAERGRGLSPATIGQRVFTLRRYEREAGPLEQADGESMAAWIASHGGEWSRESLRFARQACASWLTYRGLDAGALPRVAASAPCPRPLPGDVYARALAAADTRQRLALRLGHDAGLRVGEACQIHAQDLTRDLLGWSLLVHGKGGRVRLVPLLDDLAGELRDACTAGADGWAFPSPNGGHLTGNHLARTVRPLLEGGTFHQLRHSYATRAYQSGHDIMAVSLLLGHSSVAVTQRYIGVTAESLRDTVRAASLLAA